MHFGKPAEGKTQKHRIRGNSAVSSGSRFTYAIESIDGQNEVRMSCVKLSRGAKIQPFNVRFVIESEPTNRVVWSSARFEYVSVQEAALDRGEAFVLEQLQDGARISTTGLKEAAKGTGVSGADISRALKSLEMRRKTDFIEGDKNSKLWGLSCLPEESRQPRQAEILLARQPECLPGNQSADAFCLPSPLLGGKQQPPASATSEFRQPDSEAA